MYERLTIITTDRTLYCIKAKREMHRIYSSSDSRRTTSLQPPSVDPSARDSITGRGSMRIEQIARTDIVLPRPRAVRDVNADEGESVMAPPRGLDGSV
ncbi:hypothetical protein LSAT2_004509 [Lamellibrachia satsuma]|nr:hypothetical protein LSAT2_004509 [Lamellibrachia satsuma]